MTTPIPAPPSTPAPIPADEPAPIREDRYAIDVLNGIGSGYVYSFESRRWRTATAFVAWIDRDGSVQFGRCRSRRLLNGTTHLEVSPFPGAWQTIPLSAVRAVRHPDALG
jgi:hypothetical protein